MLATVAATLVAVPGIAVMIHKTVDHGHDEYLAVNFDQFLTGLATPSVFIELIWPLRHSDSSGEEVSIRLRLCLQCTYLWTSPRPQFDWCNNHRICHPIDGATSCHFISGCSHFWALRSTKPDAVSIVHFGSSTKAVSSR